MISDSVFGGLRQFAHPWLTRKKLASGKWPFYKHFLQGSIIKSFVKKFKTEKKLFIVC